MLKRCGVILQFWSGAPHVEVIHFVVPPVISCPESAVAVLPLERDCEMHDFLKFLIFLVAYVALAKWVLPLFGVPT